MELPQTYETLWRDVSPRPAAVPLSAAQKLLLPLGLLLFNWLFWAEKTGLNVLVYSLFVVGAQVGLRPRHAPARRAGLFWLAAAGSLFSGVMAAVYGSGVAVLASAASLLLLLGYANQPHLRLLAYALLTAAGGTLRAALAVPRAWQGRLLSGAGARRSWYYGRLLLGPLAVLAVFHGLFAVANPRYADLSGRALAAVGAWLARLWPDLTLGHLLFLGLGYVLTAGALVAVPVYYFADHESRLGEFVRRQRDRVASLGVRRPDFRARAFGALGLRKEWLMAVAVLGLVNALLLAVNIIDINWLWFGFVPAPGFDLAQFVHEGTYVLIFSILLAMALVLWFFRRNLNFYGPGLPWLRAGATAWVLQNAVLAVSVGLRNYYYIEHRGLAYKRLGVCFFLVLTLFGLGTMLLKIWQRRSVYFLVRRNALAAYAVLLVLAAGNWEVWMARYNLQLRFQTVDVGFLLDLPGRALPELLADRARLNSIPQLTSESYSGAVVVSAADAQRRLDATVAAWRQRQRTYAGWQGWNYADWQAAQALR
ncbi:DUF4153 domain-containing protein [Hymenobacter sp. PAMC 26628]|uniref:DUF4153 domain-containing protein n=1 Tax=Hymenobacter sp. PAMC 26628 TaxID=1484118 RepID=UPI0007704E1D|nr:DUF4173 domain-containing protein [Hymenobacter sp. PAMC 26628]AMJ66858.1 hypothetical protein AXW84_16550 [Hymenobacter sp. PAMC 26628]